MSICFDSRIALPTASFEPSSGPAYHKDHGGELMLATGKVLTLNVNVIWVSVERNFSFILTSVAWI